MIKFDKYIFIGQWYYKGNALQVRLLVFHLGGQGSNLLHINYTSLQVELKLDMQALEKELG